MGTIIRNNVVYGSSSNIVELSMADYQAREAAGGINSDVLYFIPDAEEYANASANTNISDFFSIEKDYVAGDYCIFNNQLYEFVEDKPAGDWDENVVTNTTITNVINNKINSLNGQVNIRFNPMNNGAVEYYYNGQWNVWTNVDENVDANN